MCQEGHTTGKLYKYAVLFEYYECMISQDNDLPDILVTEPFTEHNFDLSSPFKGSTVRGSNVSSPSAINSKSSSPYKEISDLNSPDSIPLDDPFDDYIPELCSCDQFHDDTSELLYTSCNLSVKQTLAVLFTWFASFPGISKEAFSELLRILHIFILPEGNLLPTSYAKAHSIIDSNIVPVETYHCCINDCVVYRKCSDGDFQDIEICPTCGEQWYEQASCIARKVFKYIPILPRIRRMFGNKDMSKILQDHANIRVNTYLVYINLQHGMTFTKKVDFLKWTHGDFHLLFVQME